MFATVTTALIPLFLMIIAGSFAHKLNILPENTATVLNSFVYYFTLPALIFHTMATTPFQDIMQLRFIGGYLGAIFLTYASMFIFSQIVFKVHYTESNMRATTASLSNSAYLGLPLMTYLFHGSRQALIVTTLAIILPSVLMILTVTIFEFNRTKESGSPLGTLWKVIASLLKTPMITMAFIGAAFSCSGFELNDAVAGSLKSFGMASVPCALFAVGILIVKLKIKFQFREIMAVNTAKLILHPLLAGLILAALDVGKATVLMGVVLAGLSPATLVSILAESYGTCGGETASTLLISTLLYTPALYIVLAVAFKLGMQL
nr:AEC family transporter [uncultured Desulfobacter sp.]